MEEEFKIFLDNITNTNEEEIEKEYPVFVYVLNVIILICTLTAFIADLLMIYIVAANRGIHTRKNLLIMNWAICDVVCLLATHYLSYHLFKMYTSYSLNFCILEEGGYSLQFGEFLFIFALISNTVMWSERLKNIVIICVLYFTALLTTGAAISACFLKSFIMSPIVFITFFLLFLIVLVKDVSRCCKKSPISPDSRHRLNIGRIFAYNTFISWVNLGLSEVGSKFADLHISLEIVHSMVYLNGLFILLYLIYSDHHFKMCFINMFRAKEDKYNVDATISFADFSDENDSAMVDIYLNEPKQ